MTIPPRTSNTSTEFRAGLEHRTGSLLGTLLLAALLVWFVALPAQAATVCDIQLNKTTYVTGEAVTASTLRVANTGASPMNVELKLWVGLQGLGPVSVANLGADGSVEFPAGFDQNLGPVTLFTVSSGMPQGSYEFSCRMRDPVTGALLAEDLNPFTIL